MSDQNVIKTNSNRDQNPPIRVQSSETRVRGRVRTTDQVDSPSPYPAQFEVWSILKNGIDALSLNDYGRPWPNPRRERLAALVAGYDRDLCVKAAWETREIIQSQDRAPNITRLYEKKLADLAEVRSTVRDALAGEGSTCL
jgi:hypothetical protein